MGFEEEIEFQSDCFQEIGFDEELRENTLSTIECLGGEYRYGDDLYCRQGVRQVSFVEQWFRREFWISNSPELRDLSVVVCEYPRGVQRARHAKFRTGNTSESAEKKLEKAQKKRDRFALEAGRGKSQRLVEEYASEKFLDWYESLARDWSITNRDWLVAGFSKARGGGRLGVARNANIFGVVSDYDKTFAAIRWGGSIQTVVRLALLSCDTPPGKEGTSEFTFWPRVLESRGRGKWTLFKQQREEIDDLMTVCVEQALAGPMRKDSVDPNYFKGRKVSEFAIYLFRKHLFRQWCGIASELKELGTGNVSEVNFTDLIGSEGEIDRIDDFQARNSDDE